MRVFRNVSWTFGANVFVAFTKWLIIVIIAQVSTAEAVGAYSLAFAVSAPLTLFANMKLRSLYVTEQQDNFGDYLRTRNIFSFLSIFILIVLSVTFYPDYKYIVILVTLMKVLDLQSDMYYSLPHKSEDMDYIGKHLILKHFLTLSVFTVTIINTENLTLSLLLQLIIQTIYVYFVERSMIKSKYKYNSNKVKLVNIRSIVLTGLPLGFVQMIVSFNSNYPRYLLEYFESAKVLGYFAAIAYILAIGNMLMNAISQNFLPILSKKIHNRDYDSFKRLLYINLTGLAFIIGLLIIIFVLVFGESFLTVFYGKEYSNYTDVFVLISVSIAINLLSWNLDTALLAMRYIRIQPVISIVTMVFNLIISWFLIMNYGIHGAAYSLIITNIIQLLLRIIFVNKRVNFLAKNDFTGV